MNKLLERASEILDDREAKYGKPQENFETVAKFWSLFLDHDISEKQVAMMMMLFKMARLKKNIDHKDSLLDVIGYASCLNELS